MRLLPIDKWYGHIWQASHRLTRCFTVFHVGPFTSSAAQEDMRCSIGLGSDLMFSDLFSTGHWNFTTPNHVTHRETEQCPNVTTIFSGCNCTCVFYTHSLKSESQRGTFCCRFVFRNKVWNTFCKLCWPRTLRKNKSVLLNFWANCLCTRMFREIDLWIQFLITLKTLQKTLFAWPLSLKAFTKHISQPVDGTAPCTKQEEGTWSSHSCLSLTGVG